MLRLALPVIALMAFAPLAQAEEQTYQWSLKGTAFDPPELTVPADTDFIIKFTNTNATQGELECKGLKVEKPVVAGGTITVRVLKPKAGTYLCVDEPHEDKAKANIVVK